MKLIILGAGGYGRTVADENKPYFFPSVEAGKIYTQGDRELLPLSMTCHHATTDGYHVQLFLTRLQEEIDKLTGSAGVD